MLLCNDLLHKLLDFFFVALIREIFLLGCDYASIMCGDLYAPAISKVSTWAVPATCPMETSFRQESFQKPSVLSAQAAGSDFLPGPRSKKHHNFSKVF